MAHRSVISSGIPQYQFLTIPFDFNQLMEFGIGFGWMMGGVVINDICAGNQFYVYECGNLESTENNGGGSFRPCRMNICRFVSHTLNLQGRQHCARFGMKI